MAASALASIRRFDQLVKYLRDELDWPLQSDDFEDLTFDFTPEELGIDPKNAAKIQEIKRLRPLSPNQPWGVFFVKFEPKRLPIVALRRILSSVALRRRPSANAADRRAWAAEDLLFISNYGGEGDDRQITFAHFSLHPDKVDLPTLKVLGWDNRDTPLHIDHVASTLREHLRWPTDEADVPAWRAEWRRAFSLQYGEAITTSRVLAIRLAELAKAIRDRIQSALAIETKDGRLTTLMRAFQVALVHDLDAEGFADMYAQTIAYGLLSARVTDPKAANADGFALAMPMTNPFLKELMETFMRSAGRNGDPQAGSGLDFDELGVGDVVELLDRANMEAVVRDFGDLNPQEDPVIHFYELFLSEYDAKKRMQRGVFYTPRPVVSYIVRSVDQMLRTTYGLEDGLADVATWQEMKARNADLSIPPGVSGDEAFVQILDPATGTGTFLVEVIDLIHRTMAAKWRTAGTNEAEIANLWNDYVPRHLLSRLHGFELLMAPYAIAHLKLGLKLGETGYRFGSADRIRVYLTNALEPPTDHAAQMEFKEWTAALAHEAQAVNKVKADTRFTVVVGNPPYSGVSSNRNEWIEGLLKGRDSRSVGLANYYEAEGQPLGERKIWLQDDYVKFTRLSQYLLERASVGVHGMITNHSYLDSPTCRGMRFQMMTFFSDLAFIDMHGSTKRGESAPGGLDDENVFDILPGVGIAICARGIAHEHSAVRSYDLWGSRIAKSAWLTGHDVTNVDWTELLPTAPYFLFVQRQLDFEKEYQTFASLKELMPTYGTGIQTSRDGFATDFDRASLEQRLRAFFDLNRSDEAVALEFGLSDTRGWKMADVRRRTTFGEVQETIAPYMFRVFDKRWIALTKDVVDWPRLDVMSCVGPGRIGLLCSRQQAVPGFRHALAVDSAVDMFCLSNKSREGQTLFPLFVAGSGQLFNTSDDELWSVNLGPGFTGYLGKLWDRPGLGSGLDPLSTADARRAFNYIYAVLYSGSYRLRYSDLLKMEYPRLPLGADRELFGSLERCGAELCDIHLMEAPALTAGGSSYVGADETPVERVTWHDDTVWLDGSRSRTGESATGGTAGFSGVPEPVWNFEIGGYQVCEKWLKDRRGRSLSRAEREQYQRLLAAVAETQRIMIEIDELIEGAGGWPDAFDAF